MGPAVFEHQKSNGEPEKVEDPGGIETGLGGSGTMDQPFTRSPKRSGKLENRQRQLPLKILWRKLSLAWETMHAVQYKYANIFGNQQKLDDARKKQNATQHQ